MPDPVLIAKKSEERHGPILKVLIIWTKRWTENFRKQ